jgi:eukaryotic-like serine/threonine-protein kinase
LPGIDPKLQDALRDHYLLERELGRGGMATVYLARDLKHDRLVALKVLHPELAATIGPDRFLREIKLAARLQHPHLLSVHDSGETAGQLWFTMPYIEGESLRDRLRREGQIPVDDAVQITREAAQALDYAHQHGVIHRDLKPENILLTQDGSVLVADFGVARALGGAAEERLTETGMSLGTPAYMSPEQAAGERTIDARTDVYSLACVLYEMLAGEPPFTGPTAQAIIAKRFSTVATPVRVLRSDVPENVDQAITTALARAPAGRFPSTGEFAGALKTSAGRPKSDTRRIARFAAMVIGLILLAGAAWTLLGRRTSSRAAGGDSDRKMLVVLPFENLGSAEDDYFADGLTEAIGTRLGALRGLGIIARQSAMQYKRTAKSPRQIGQELGVQYILSGTVRRDRSGTDPSRIRVSPQLVQVADQRQLWAEQYDTALAGVFEVESALAARVARALDLALVASGSKSLEAPPTRNLDAYDAYLRGREANDRGFDPKDFTEAGRMYERAVALDPGFAAAFAQLSINETFIFWLYIDRSAARLARAKAALDRAQQLGPDLPETHLALANYHYRSALDYDRALAELDALERVRPGDPELARWRGFIRRRQGRWEESVVELQRAARLNPRAAAGYADIADSYLFMRRYDEAYAALDRALALNPHSGLFALQKALAYLSLAGDREGMQRLMPGISQGFPLVGGPTAIMGFAEVVPLLSRQQQAGLLQATPQDFGGDTAGWALARAMTYRAWRQDVPARAAFETARVVLERLLAVRPDDHAFLAEYGLALAGLGRAEEAIRQGKRAVEVRSTARDATEGPLTEANLARIYTMVGRPELAIDQLRTILSRPGPLSPAWLRVDPFFASLRGDPRFQRLAADTTRQ